MRRTMLVFALLVACSGANANVAASTVEKIVRAICGTVITIPNVFDAGTEDANTRETIRSH